MGKYKMNYKNGLLSVSKLHALFCIYTDASTDAALG